MKFNFFDLTIHITWQQAIQSKEYRAQFLVFVVLLIAALIFLPVFFHEVIGPKPGRLLNDRVLSLFKPADYSLPIFILIYSSLVILIQGIYLQPTSVLIAMKSYLALLITRMITMYVFTLQPPQGIIELRDPLVDTIAYGGNVFAKDLFFSGHVATLTLFVLLEKRTWAKVFITISTLMVGAFLMMQHVHYTIDIVCAPFFSLAIVISVKKKI